MINHLLLVVVVVLDWFSVVAVVVDVGMSNVTLLLGCLLKKTVSSKSAETVVVIRVS